MAMLKVSGGGQSLEFQIPDEMRSATDEQILSYVRERTGLEVSNLQVERTAEAILVHPEAIYG